MRSRAWRDELERVDVAVYGAVARTRTPALDVAMRRLSRAADYSRLSLASAAVLALAGGERGRRSASAGLASVALTATVVNAVFKPLGRRRRPERSRHGFQPARHVRMPRSHSWPSGHTAAAFAFATGVGSVQPEAALPLWTLAAAVG